MRRSDRLHQQQQQRTFHINAEVGWRLLAVPRDAPQLADLPLHLQRRQRALGRLRRLDTSERARRAGTRWRCSAGLQHLSTASVRQLGMGQSTFHRIPTRRTHACGMTNWRRACYGNTRTRSRYQRPASISVPAKQSSCRPPSSRRPRKAASSCSQPHARRCGLPTSDNQLGH
jgi:hypothetical protein